MLRVIEKTLNRKLLPQEEKRIIENEAKLNKSAYKKQADFVQDLIKLSIDSGKALIYNKKESKKITVDKFLGIDSLPKLKQIINPGLKYERNYIFIDSFNALQEGTSGNSGVFKWNFDNTGSRQDGTITMIGEVKELVKIKIYQPMMSQPTTSIDTNFTQISILMENFRAQSFRSNSGRRFHFLLRPVQNLFNSADGSYDLRAEHPDQLEYYFTKPINVINDISVSLGDPDTVLSFYPSKYSTTFTYGATTTLTFNTAHGLTISSVYEIFMRDFTTDDPSGDAAIIAQFNNESVPLRATAATATTMTVAVDTSSITPTADLSVFTWVTARRLAFAMELTFKK